MSSNEPNLGAARAKLSFGRKPSVSRLPMPDTGHRFLNSYWADRAGSMSTVFALAIVPIVACAGMAVDLGRAHYEQQKLQSAVDAASLMALHDAGNRNGERITQEIEHFVAENLKGSRTASINVSSQYNAATSTLDVSVKSSVSTTLMQVLGITEIPISAKSQAAAGIGTLELALVLDNTGSMSGNGKIQALISASHDLLTTLQNAAGSPDAVKVAIVPFDTHVNIGLASLTEPWIDWSFYDPLDVYGSEADAQQVAAPGCTTGNSDGDNNDNGKGKCKAKVAQAFNATWTGCVIDRDLPWDVENTLPTADPATFYPAMDCGLSPLLPLTNNWTALNATVDLMQASGSTDLPIGLVWGWNMLTQNAPLSTATAPSPDKKRVIVFLTDGENTKNAWTTNATDIDARTLEVCNNIKADNVQIFTIRVMNGNAALLQNCASDPSMYYEVTQANQMVVAFHTFARSLVKPPHLTN